MKLFILLTLSTLIAIFFTTSSGKTDISVSEKPISSSPGKDSIAAPTIELVFCLDATGSMKGLIHTAKEKIWDIVNVVAQSKPAPVIRLGMIFYRDLSDEFVTKVYPQTENLDSIYSELLLIEADGGGDEPESVNQAINEAVMQMKWTSGNNTYRTIFLVGDCPPHMNYKQDVKYLSSCKLAREKGIVINTIKLGSSCTSAIEHFRTIAKETNGDYMQLEQNADDVVIETPYDDSISYYSNKLDASKIYYGDKQMQTSMITNQQQALRLYKHSSKNAIASRGKFSTNKSGEKNFYGTNELVQEIITNKIKLENIKEEELPENMVKMTKEERINYIEKLKIERVDNLENLKRLTTLREGYISDKMKEKRGKSSFSAKIFEVIKKQATSKGVQFVD